MTYSMSAQAQVCAQTVLYVLFGFTKLCIDLLWYIFIIVRKFHSSMHNAVVCAVVNHTLVQDILIRRGVGVCIPTVYICIIGD